MTNSILRGKPDAGNPHVRFDEGEVASEKPRRGSLLYKRILRFRLAALLTLGACLACAPAGAEPKAGALPGGETRTYRGIRPTDPQGRDGLANPERGFRLEIGVGRRPNDVAQFRHLKHLKDWSFPRYKKDGVTLAQAYCYLTEFYASPISEDKLAALQADFDRARREGYKFALRFAYEGVTDEIPPPSLEQVLAHIRQLTPMIRRNIDVIYVLETGWFGLWGEFHSSATGLDQRNTKAITALMKATLEMLPEDRFTMLRCMRYKTRILKELGDDREITAATAFTPAPHARIGFYNDGTLADPTDGGTFITEPYGAFGNPEFDRVARESPYMPVGGELYWTKLGGAKMEFANGLKAIQRFHDLHYSLFSLVHGFSEQDANPDPWTIDSWKQAVVTPQDLTSRGIPFDPDYFTGVPNRTTFEFIRDHLGYRLKLESLRLESVADGKTKLTAKIHNVGFGTPINRRTPYFVVLAPEGTCREYAANLDCRKFLTGSTQNLAATIPALKPGERLALWLPDAALSIRQRPEFAIRLANALEVKVVDGRLLNLL